MRATLAAIAFAAFSLTAAAQTVAGVDPTAADRGTPVRLRGTGFHPDMHIYLLPVGRNSHSPAVPVEQIRIQDKPALDADKTLAMFSIPAGVPLGTYFVGLRLPGSNTSVYGPTKDVLRVQSTAPVEITAVYRDPAYATDDGYELNVVGKGFSTVAVENVLVLGRKAQPNCRKPGETDCVVPAVLDGGRTVRFSNVQRDGFRIERDVQVRVGDKQSEPIRVRLSHVGEQTPLRIAIAVVSLIAALLLYLAWAAKPKHTAAKTNRWNAFFIDAQTNTYSLSMLQFYLWTIAAVFGYVYLAGARALVQGDPKFVDIPAGIPAVFGISAATSALAIGITNMRGSKGAGDLGPSRADYLTTGGVVAADRVQFFVWTVVGWVTFITLVLLRSPGTIEDLPTVPDGFLLLMGVSSAGYLGGKLVRKPGPKITAVKGDATTGKLEITGEHLSRKATLMIGDKELGTGDYKVAPAFTGGDNAEFATNIVATLNTGFLTTGTEHTVTLVNPDGQRAVAKFTP